MITSPAVPPRPGAALVGALDELERLIEQMSHALTPAMSHSYNARSDHGTGDGYTETMWQLLKAFTFTVQAARAGHVGDAAEVHDALREVDVVARTAAGYVRGVRAAAAGPAELALMDAPGADAGRDLGDAQTDVLTARVGAYFEDTDTAVADELEISLLNADARREVTWRGRRGPLALDGRTHLDLVAAAETIAAAYDRYLRDTAIQDALGIDPNEAR
ncbi:hypothetical protein [Streptosporangium sp. V21-05]|uniref:hypothetical protein n=1 Tax=Streptosporangium sp. V21-05 TaxID=3446115 RepID=UPI003F52C791